MPNKQITWADIEAAAERLDLEPCLIQAVVDVECERAPFLPSGLPTILFEGHVFWDQLLQAGMDPRRIDAPDILFPRPDPKKYRGGESEWIRLEKAIGIHKDAALSSASWGAFQIMGFNYAACGFANVEAFATAMKSGKQEQIAAFIRFMNASGHTPYLRRCDFAGFAKRYNGPACKKRKYDARLRWAYRNCMAAKA